MQHGAPFFFAVEGVQRDNLTAPAVTLSLDFPLSSTVFNREAAKSTPASNVTLHPPDVFRKATLIQSSMRNIAPIAALRCRGYFPPQQM
jgi:hypothetical protein